MNTRLSFFSIIALSCAFVQAGTGTWQSSATGGSIAYRTTNASQPAKDVNGKYMTVVYLENLSCPKVGQNSNADDVQWLLSQGYRVIELDYDHHQQAVAPQLNLDIIAINDALNSGSFCGTSNISPDRAYVLFEGYRIQRDVAYYLDDPTVYNYPAAYTADKADSLYMDIVYPANPSHPVPTVLSFSYSNSYAGTANEGYVTKYRHKRMFLGYTYSMFDDSILEGAPALGMAWAIADHPKYCDWGRGNRANGSQKEFGAIEVNPDAARKVRSAVRTVRGFGKGVGLGDEVAVYGFSRGSTAASLAIGDAPFADWLDTERGSYPEERNDVQAAVLGPGVFDYNRMGTSTNEYKHMAVYCNSTASPAASWAQQGGALAIQQKASPCFLFYNADDDAQYGIQMNNLISILERTQSTYQLLKDYGTGHSVPQRTEHLMLIYQFLQQHLQIGSEGVSEVHAEATAAQPVFSLTGMTLHEPQSGFNISSGKVRYIR